MTLILITNDDGIRSPGLGAIAAAVSDLGDVLIAAPNRQQTSMSRAKPKYPTQGIVNEITVEFEGQFFPAYEIEGSPTQSVVHAILEIADKLPDLCVSGANYGENIGGSLTGSGTVMAAIEAASFGMPAIAVSRETPHYMAHMENYPQLDWSAVQYFTHRLARHVLENGLPDQVEVLNLNVPEHATPQTPIRQTVQEFQRYYYFTTTAPRDFKTPMRLSQTKGLDSNAIDPMGDVKALYDGVVSVTPLCRLLTAHNAPPNLTQGLMVE